MKTVISAVLALAGSAAADPIEMRAVGQPGEYPPVVANETACAHLAIETKQGWYLADGSIISYTGAHMTDAPAHVSLVSESLSTASLEDHSPALVYLSVTRHEEVEWKTGRVVSSILQADVMICRFDDPVACGRIRYNCPASGCVAPSFEGGVLRTIERHDYPIRSTTP